MSFVEPNNPRSSEIVNNQIQQTELATYEERTPGLRSKPPSQVLTYVSPSSWFAHISMALLKLAGGALLQL